ncbi:hypothetical protein Tco_0999090 [Tanacetum coccineum]
MGDENPIHTLGDYSKSSHEVYRNTIELPVGNNMVPIRFDTIRLVQNGCSFHGLRPEDPNQHLKDFLKLLDLLDLDGENRERMRLGPHDTKYCMENPEQAFVEYASSRTDEAGIKWYTFKPEQNNLGDTYNSSWKSHQNLSQSNIEGLVSSFMVSQDARLSKFEADFKQQQSEMTNKIDTMLKSITDRIAGTLPSDTVKNPKLETHPVLTEGNKEGERDGLENHPDSQTPPNPSVSFITKKVLKFNLLFESLGLVPHRPTLNSFASKKEMAT